MLTLPPEHLVDRATYLRAVDLTGPDGAPSPTRARERRDLAVEGFVELREQSESGDPAPLEAFHAAAARIVAPALASWRERWEHGAVEAARQSGRQIDALAAGDHTHLRDARVTRIDRPEQDTLGMCGTLAPYTIPQP